MKKIFFISIALGSTLMFSSCFYDKKDQIYPQTLTATCDTTNSTYAAVVVPILNSNCNNCHAASVASKIGAGIILDSYNSLKIYVSNKQLINSINHTGGITPMPLNGVKMNACDISKIGAWVNRGALNN
jgi:mono/diheme cytochrome c family protein